MTSTAAADNSLSGDASTTRTQAANLSRATALNPAPSLPASRPAFAPNVSSGTATATVTLTQTQTEAPPEILRLSLQPRPTIRWDENVVDNEGLGRKTSKRCCIFHKQRAFGESSTDSSDAEEDGDDSRKIARPKGQKKVPDYQRFHA